LIPWYTGRSALPWSAKQEHKKPDEGDTIEPDNRTGKYPSPSENTPAGPTGSGPENSPNPEIPKKPVKNPRLADRVTALYSAGIPLSSPKRCSRRKETLVDLHGADPEIPYRKFERSAQDLVCSLMERQDRMNEEIFRRIGDCRDEMEELSERLAQISDKLRKSDGGPAGRSAGSGAGP